MKGGKYVIFLKFLVKGFILVQTLQQNVGAVKRSS